MSHPENMYIKVSHDGCASAKLSCRSNTGCFIHLAAISHGVCDSLSCFPKLHLLWCHNVSLFPLMSLLLCEEPVVKFEVPECYKEGGSLMHISTSCRLSILPDDALYFFRTSLSLFWPGAILLSHLPFRSSGAGLCRKIPALTCFLINLTFHSQFLWHVLNPNLSRSEVLKGREEGRDRGEEKDREGKSVWKVQGLLYFDFPGGRTDSSYGSIIGYGLLTRGTSG